MNEADTELLQVIPFLKSLLDKVRKFCESKKLDGVGGSYTSSKCPLCNNASVATARVIDVCTTGKLLI